MLFKLFKLLFTSLDWFISAVDDLIDRATGNAGPYEITEIPGVQHDVNEMRNRIEHDQDALLPLALHEISTGNIERGLLLLDLSSRSGRTEASYLLGFFYFQGELGVQKNPDHALEYFLLGAQLGDHACQAALGRLYFGKCEFTQAYIWSSLSSLQGNESAESTMNFLKLFLSRKHITFLDKSTRELMLEIEENKRQVQNHKNILNEYRAIYADEAI